MRVPSNEIVHDEFTDARYQLKPFTGVAYHEWDGLVSAECEFLAGERHGVDREFYPNQQLRSSTCYTHGREDGVAVAYSPNGQIERTALYENGELVQCKEFGPSGTKLMEFDRETGIESHWRETGSLRAQYFVEHKRGLRVVVEEHHFDHNGEPTIVRRNGEWRLTSADLVAGNREGQNQV